LPGERRTNFGELAKLEVGEFRLSEVGNLLRQGIFDDTQVRRVKV